ncbi:hypothetical protein ABIE89_001633 [Bradyrhizobium niftali]
MPSRRTLSFAVLMLLGATLGACVTTAPLPNDQIAAGLPQTVVPVSTGTPRASAPEIQDVRSRVSATASLQPAAAPAPQVTSSQPSASPQSFTPEYVGNLRSCLAGLYGCKREMLAGDDVTKVNVVDQERNFSACLSGYPSCEATRLTPDQQARVGAANQERNLRACLAGYPSCQAQNLSAEQRQAKELRDRERNVSACLNGYPSCREDVLSQEEKASAAARRADRNFSSCSNGYASCKLGDLLPEQRERVAVAAKERNLSRCLASLSTCKVDELSADDLQNIQKKRQETAALPSAQGPIVPVPSYVPRSPGCAENGSCYGDVSALTGLPKTVAVRGYFRSNGTYVRGHYRSHR